MDPLISTLALIFLALLGARMSFSTLPVPAGPRLLLRTGTHFVFLGVLLGPHLLGLATPDAMDQLRPLITLGLGWIGLLFGLQLDRSAIRLFPVRFHMIAGLQAFGTLVAVLIPGTVLLMVFGRLGPEDVGLVGAIAATASVSTPAGVALVSTNYHVRGPVAELLLFISSVDAVIGIVALQAVYTLFPPDALTLGVAFAPALIGLPLAVGLGVVFAILFVWLSRPRPSPEEHVLYLLGLSALASGAAFWLQLSPLFLCVVTGAVLANIDPDAARIHRTLQAWEKPVYVVLLLLAGAFLQLPSLTVIPLAVGYALFRALGKIGASALAVRAFPPDFPIPRRLGMGLVPQGGITLAMAVSVLLTYQGVGFGEFDVGEIVFEVVLIGAVLSELVGPLLTMSVLRRAGEIAPAVEQALSEGDGERAFQEAMAHGSRRGDPDDSGATGDANPE